MADGRVGLSSGGAVGGAGVQSLLSGVYAGVCFFTMLTFWWTSSCRFMSYASHGFPGSESVVEERWTRAKPGEAKVTLWFGPSGFLAVRKTAWLWKTRF